MKITQDFVLFRAPNESHFKLWNLGEKEEETYFIFHSFDNKITHRLYKKDEASLSYDELSKVEFDLNLKSIDQSVKEQSHDEYIERCNYFIEALKNNELNKVIFSRIKYADFNEDFGEKLVHLAHKYPKAMVYLANFKGETWLGASPEKLVQIDNNELTTVALASTKAVSDNRDWTEKEYKEHQLVVDYVYSYLKDFNPSKGEAKTISLGEIQHLKTKFSAQLIEQHDPERICNLLHPTPAVCGMPKEKAHQFILENEGYDRSFYTGYFGVISKGYTEVYVNLRCAQVYTNKLAAYVGGGLLAESEAEKEWQETEWKSKALLS